MEPRTIESLHCSDSRLECDSQSPTVMQGLDPGEVSRYTVATPVSIQFWNVIPNFRICESQMDPIPELNRYTVAIQCWNGKHRWNPGELNRYTVAVQFWNGIQKNEPRRIQSLHCSGSILEWDSHMEPRRIQSLHCSGSILEWDSKNEPWRIQSLHCSGSILEWDSHMEPRRIIL